MTQIDKFQEASDRNYALVKRYGSLPSYAYFRPDDEALDDPQKCAKWWQTWLADETEYPKIPDLELNVP